MEIVISGVIVSETSTLHVSEQGVHSGEMSRHITCSYSVKASDCVQRITHLVMTYMTLDQLMSGNLIRSTTFCYLQVE